MRLVSALALAVLAAACDPPVGPAAHAAPGGDRLGRELESCARTADCAPPLRCVSAVCTPDKTSGVGEYHWAVARRLAAASASPAAAIAAYQRASAQFEADKLPIPPALLCDHGALLARAGDPKASEQAARLLHRCLLATPPASPLRERALAELAALGPRGLDPALLARDTPADLYLVRSPTPPAPDSARIAVARSTPASDKGYEAFARLLESGAARPAIVRCWQEQWKQTSRSDWTVALPLRLRARLDADEQYAGGTLELGGDDPGVACLRGALATLVAEFTRGGSSGSWQGALTISVTAL